MLAGQFSCVRTHRMRDREDALAAWLLPELKKLRAGGQPAGRPSCAPGAIAAMDSELRGGHGS